MRMKGMIIFYLWNTYSTRTPSSLTRVGRRISLLLLLHSCKTFSFVRMCNNRNYVCVCYSDGTYTRGRIAPVFGNTSYYGSLLGHMYNFGVLSRLKRVSFPLKMFDKVVLLYVRVPG